MLNDNDRMHHIAGATSNGTPWIECKAIWLQLSCVSNVGRRNGRRPVRRRGQFFSGTNLWIQYTSAG